MYYFTSSGVPQQLSQPMDGSQAQPYFPTQQQALFNSSQGPYQFMQVPPAGQSPSQPLVGGFYATHYPPTQQQQQQQQQHQPMIVTFGPNNGVPINGPSNGYMPMPPTTGQQPVPSSHPMAAMYGHPFGQHATPMHYSSHLGPMLQQPYNSSMSPHIQGMMPHHPFYRQSRPSPQSSPQPQAASVDEAAPCDHNNWDNLRAKNSVVTLCCRDCQKKWKQQFPIRNLCPEFHMRLVCAFGTDCPFLHVHRFKSVLKSPNPPGHVVGSVRDKVFANLAIEVLAEHPGKEPRDVVDEVKSRYLEPRATQFDKVDERSSNSLVNQAPNNDGTAAEVPHGTSSSLPQLPASFFPIESQRDYWSDDTASESRSALLSSLPAEASPRSVSSFPEEAQCKLRQSGGEEKTTRQSCSPEAASRGGLQPSFSHLQQGPGGQLHGSSEQAALPYLVPMTGHSHASPVQPVSQSSGRNYDGGQAVGADSNPTNASGGTAAHPQALQPVQLPNGQIVYLLPPNQ